MQSTGPATRRPPPGGPAARPACALEIKPGQQSETFGNVAAEMRKSGAAQDVIKLVLAAGQEARHRQSEAKALSKLDAACDAASQAQASVETAEAVVAAAEEALTNACHRLEEAQQKHQERVASVHAQENALLAPKTAKKQSA